MAGIVTTPELTTFEMTLPEIEPCSALEMMPTWAAPPRYRPTSANARSLKKRPPPVKFRATPKTMKPTTISAKARIGIPKADSALAKWKPRVSGSDCGEPLSGLGISSATTG
jgi:hypothetical protein